jgi:hypothetical protein
MNLCIVIYTYVVYCNSLGSHSNSHFIRFLAYKIINIWNFTRDVLDFKVFPAISTVSGGQIGPKNCNQGAAADCHHVPDEASAKEPKWNDIQVGHLKAQLMNPSGMISR